MTSPLILGEITPKGGCFRPDRDNPALFTNEKREIFMRDSPDLEPKANDCVVRMRCNGICG
jgi:L-iditol 2-dehydrogenase